MNDRNRLSGWILAGMLVTATSAHAQATFADLYGTVIQNSCGVGCHTGDQNGGMRWSVTSGGVDAERKRMHEVVVNVPSNRSNSGKLRVHSYAPELSFFLEKARGYVTAGEGDPMPRGGLGLLYTAPGYVHAIEEWIRAGAPGCTGAPQSSTCPKFMDGFIQIGRPQPTFSPSAPAGTTLTLEAEEFTVAHRSTDTTMTREGTHTSTVNATNETSTNVTAIHVRASAGTVSVALYRGEDDAPVAVARGNSLDLELPPGVGLPIEAGQTFRIVQHVRNDYFLAPGDLMNPEVGRYHNLTKGEAVVYLATSDAAVVAAQPLVDTTGTDVLFAPAGRIGVTGGVWPANPAEVTGATVGVWSDDRAIAAALVDPASQQILTENGEPEDDEGLRTGYVDVAGTASIAYSCVHNNGASNVLDRNLAFVTTLANANAAPVVRPVRTACTTDRNLPSGLPAVVADALDLGDQTCWRDHDPSQDPPATAQSFGSDCEGSAMCRPANLVGGDSFDEGRCTLVGLWW